jgi:transcription elongation factor GreA
VTLYDADKDGEIKYQIVGDLESDIKEFRIAVTSPIARAMIGKEEGDEIVVDAPGGELVYEIVDVEYI